MNRQRPIDKVSPHRVLESYLLQHNMRRTPERYAILDRILELPHHFNIDTVCSIMNENSYRVSRATVYNTIQLLVDAGILRCHRFNGRQSRYEVIVDTPQPNHLHLICRVCGSVKEVNTPEMSKLIDGSRFRSFAAEYYSLYIYGVCSACRRRARRELNKPGKT